MINTLKNSDGLVYAYIEWTVVNKQGKPDGSGKYVYISDLWIHPEHANGFGKFRVIQKLIPGIMSHRFTKFSEYVYWENEKSGKITGPFSIDILLKRSLKNVTETINSPEKILATSV